MKALGSPAALALLAALACPAAAAQTATDVAAARVWPSSEYTRVTLESRAPIQYNLFTLENPARVVLDLEDVNISPTLTSLVDNVGTDDPHVQAVRIGRFKPGEVGS